MYAQGLLLCVHDGLTDIETKAASPQAAAFLFAEKTAAPE